MKQQLTNLLLVTSFLPFAYTAQAQIAFHIGPQVGYNLATANYQDPAPLYPSTNTYRSGVAAGLVAQVSFGHLAVQSAVRYEQKGYNRHYSYGNTTSSYNSYTYSNDITNRFGYLTIPLNLVFTQKATGEGAQVFAGPYVGFLVGGHYSYNSLENDNGLLNYEQGAGSFAAGNEDDPTVRTGTRYTRRLDAGLQAGIGYRYHELLVQAGYSLGLRNVAADFRTSTGIAYSSPTYHNRAFQVSLAYLFGHKS